MTKHYSVSVAILVILTTTNSPVLAKWGQFTITDDNGEQVIVKHGLFGKKTIVKDRFGDGFQNKKSIFGLTKDTQVSALGNDVHVHKGLFGFGKTEGQDMLGDTVSSKKNLFYRNTNVNLSGANNLFNKYFTPQKGAAPSVGPNAINQPAQLPSSPNIQPLSTNSPSTPITPGESTPSY